MKEGVFSVKQNMALLLSTGAALCLFLQPVKIVIALEALIFALVAFVCVLEKNPVPKGNWGAGVMTGCFCAVGFLTFSGEWETSSLVAKLASILGLPQLWLVYLLAFLGTAVGAYAFWRLACRLEGVLGELFRAPAGKPDWGFVISAGCFFLAEPEPGRDPLCCLLAALGVCFAAGRYLAPLRKEISGQPLPLRLLGLLTALGICWFRLSTAAAAWDMPLAARLLGLLSIPFVAFCVCVFFRWLQGSLSGVFRDISRAEAVFYSVIALVLLAAVTLVFCQTDAFYGTAHPYDIVYTSDSHILVEGNAWLNLTDGQNDLRQPLYAVFSAPFVGLSWLIRSLLPASPVLDALALNLPQLLVLLFAHFLLATTLGLRGIPRMAFFAGVCMSYPSLLFSFMMEQYIFVYFYAVLFVHLYCRGRRSDAALWGAGGTLLTSVILLPMLPERHPVKEFKAWFHQLLQSALGFVLVLLAFARVDIILDAGSAIVELGQFTGEKLTLAEKFLQYTTFPASCFTAPQAEVTENLWGVLSWQLIPASSLHWTGIGLLLICVGSALICWKDPLSRICLGWIGFSFLLLFGLGWGTQENGLVLYSLYFGWAFWGLLCRLTQKLEALFRRKALLPILWTLAAILLAFVNLPALGSLVTFALTHYPL